MGNSSAQKLTNLPTAIEKEMWIDDADREYCSNQDCNIMFKVTIRKHHCRLCGEVYCGECTSKRQQLLFSDGLTKNVRICNICDLLTMADIKKKNNVTDMENNHNALKPFSPTNCMPAENLISWILHNFPKEIIMLISDYAELMTQRKFLSMHNLSPRKSKWTLIENDITVDHCRIIGYALQSNTCLRELRLFGNKIGDVGVIYISNALLEHQNLTMLSLGRNEITNEGAISIAQGLASNISLLSLHLDRNMIGNIGAISICKSLETNHVLERLYLGYNKINDIGATSIGTSIMKNSTIRIIGLFGNNISAKNKRMLFGMKTSHPTLNSFGRIE